MGTLPLFEQGEPDPARHPIILLDLNYTLVEGSDRRFAFRGSYARWIEQERYRGWLVDLLREHTVLLVTARRVRYEPPTLDRIRATCGGWMPTETYFRVEDESPPRFKAHVFAESIAPRWAASPARYIALESNAATRRAYARIGVRAVRVPTVEPDNLRDSDLLQLVDGWDEGSGRG